MYVCYEFCYIDVDFCFDQLIKRLVDEAGKGG